MSSLADRIREIDHNHEVLRTSIRNRLPALLPEFGKMIVGTVIGFGIVTLLLRRYTHVNPLWVLGGVALMYSLRAAYYKFKLATDPTFRVPKCGCAGGVHDRTEIVLQSPYSTLLRVPNAVLGALLYVALLVTAAVGANTVATTLAVVALLCSVYLAYVMVVRIRALCPTCVTVAGLNLLIVWQLLS